MRKSWIYLVLILLAVYVLGPFIWMLSTSLKPEGDALAKVPHLIPLHWQFSTYISAWKSAPFGRYFLNSFFISGVETVADLSLGAMAAYAFARMEFFGKRTIFIILLATMMVPGEVLLIPNYITIANLGWLDTYQGLIVPWLISIFTIFLMRQFFLSLPQELFEAAELDGCGPMRTLFGIVLPNSKPIWITSALIKFVGAWNSFLWVLIVTNTPQHFTIPVGLINFSTNIGTIYDQLMAAATFTMIPLIILFLFGQRYFIEGIARSGIK